MQTELADFIRDTPEGREADAILRTCVHCGFCTATCPTYQLLGDELDSPRGRIYLIKQVLEGAPVTDKTRLHLDRCLTCRSCETTCPSGVRYGRLVDIGRAVVEAQAPRAPPERAARGCCADIACRGAALRRRRLRSGRLARRCCPRALRARCPTRAAPPARGRRRATRARCWCSTAACSRARAEHQRRRGARARPHRHLADRASPRRRLLRRAALPPELPGRAGATHARATSTPGGRMSSAASRGDRHDRERLRRDGEGIRPPACAATRRIAEKAQRISALTRDLSRSAADSRRWSRRAPQVAAARRFPFAVHAAARPAARAARSRRCCARSGFELTPVADAHLCCGSAGTYSLLQPALAARAAREQARRARGRAAGRHRHRQHRLPDAPAAAQRTPVRHWIELLDVK